MHQPGYFLLRNASLLTGLSERQIRDWTQAGLVTPQYPSDRGRPSEHVYSFRDLLALRLIGLLRERGVPLNRLGDIQPWIEANQGQPWDDQRLWVAGREIAFGHPAEGSERVELGPIVQELGDAVQRLRERAPDQVGRVTRERGTMGGAWVLAGTRVPTSAIWSFYEAGYDRDGILVQYPHLAPEDIDAAIAHERQLRESAAHPAP